MTITCIAVDDEPPALLQMKNYISRVPFLNLMGTFDNAMDTIQFLKNSHVDLLFLDIEMEGFSGIQLLNVLKHRPKVILTTAYDQYAIKAFDLDVSDYLLKPISFERFLQAVDKISETNYQNNETSGSKSNAEPPERNYIFVKTEYRLEKIKISDILYIEGMNEYLKIVTMDKNILTLQNFKYMEEMLPKDNFVRVHKSYIVAIDKIENIERNRIKIQKMIIPISETYKDAFFKKIGTIKKNN